MNPASRDGAAALDEVRAFIGRFCALPAEHAYTAATLWAAHAHVLDAFDSTPRLAFLSPEPGSGKTRALEILTLLVPWPMHAVNATPAALFRSVADKATRRTILFDEIDTIFGPKAKEHEELRGLLNAGHRRSGVAYRCDCAEHLLRMAHQRNWPALHQAAQRATARTPHRPRSLARRTRGRRLMDNITYDVRIWKTEIYKGAKVTTHAVRWKTGPRPWKQPFRTKAQAASFEAELRSAARKGEAFDITTGRPVSWGREDNDMSWYEFCVSYVDMKWKGSSAHHRENIAWALIRVMPAMLACDKGKPDGMAMRTARCESGRSIRSNAATARTMPPPFSTGSPATRSP